MKLSVSLLCASVLASFSLCDAHAKDGDYIRTPAGRIHRDCVHTVASGSLIDSDERGRVTVTEPLSVSQRTRVLPKCKHDYKDELRRHLVNVNSFDGASQNNNRKLLQFPPDYDGWLTYTAWNTSSISSFTGYFSVPAAPLQSPDILYIFTGLQNVDWIPKVDPIPAGFDIIQPVLQFPSDSSSDDWSIKSWYVTVDSGAIQSTEIIVQPGDNIFGNMTRTGSSSWYIGSSTDSSPSKITSINVNKPRLISQPWAYNTIECYGCYTCSNLPSSSPSLFTALALSSDEGDVLSPEWRDTPKPPTGAKVCKERATIVSPEAVTFDFN